MFLVNIAIIPCRCYELVKDAEINNKYLIFTLINEILFKGSKHNTSDSQKIMALDLLSENTLASNILCKYLLL